jgi:hypothetical protein
MTRLGAPVSAPSGCSIEAVGKGRNRRISLRAWHPLVNIPAQHFSIGEFLGAFKLALPPRKQPAKWKKFPAAKRVAA